MDLFATTSRGKTTNEEKPFQLSMYLPKNALVLYYAVSTAFCLYLLKELCIISVIVSTFLCSSYPFLALLC